MEYETWTVPMLVVGKPRMTQRDKWAKRPPVLRYRAFADELRLRSPKDLPERPSVLHIDYTVPMPKLWSKKKQAEKIFTLHDEKPDCDNSSKGVADILFSEDKTIGSFHVDGLWIATTDRPSISISVGWKGTE